MRTVSGMGDPSWVCTGHGSMEAGGREECGAGRDDEARGEHNRTKWGAGARSVGWTNVGDKGSFLSEQSAGATSVLANMIAEHKNVQQ